MTNSSVIERVLLKLICASFDRYFQPNCFYRLPKDLRPRETGHVAQQDGDPWIDVCVEDRKWYN